MWLFGGKEVWVTVDEERWLSAVSKWGTLFRTVEQELWLSQLSVHQGLTHWAVPMRRLLPQSW